MHSPRPRRPVDGRRRRPRSRILDGRPRRAARGGNLQRHGPARTHDDGGVRWLPGCLDDVVAVRADWACARDAYDLAVIEDRKVITTSPYPRDIPGVPRERNVNGVSFAVANASGFVARALELSPRAGREELLALLAEAASRERAPV